MWVCSVIPDTAALLYWVCLPFTLSFDEAPLFPLKRKKKVVLVNNPPLSYSKSTGYRVCWFGGGLCRHMPDHLPAVLRYLTSHLAQVAWSSLPLRDHLASMSPRWWEAGRQAAASLSTSTDTVSLAAGVPSCPVGPSQGPGLDISLWIRPVLSQTVALQITLGYCVPGRQAFWRKAGFI